MRTIMNEFNKIQEIWNSQPDAKTSVLAGDIIQKAETHLKNIKHNYIGTTVILSITVGILVAYFLWISFYGWSLFTIGISLMIGMLVWRIALELISIKRFSRIKPDGAFIIYSERITTYHVWRKKVHLIFTPVIYLSYIIGFIFLLQAFKANLSTGLFWYCVISGSVFLIGFGMYLIQLIRKEIKTLEYLKEIRI